MSHPNLITALQHTFYQTQKQGKTLTETDEGLLEILRASRDESNAYDMLAAQTMLDDWGIAADVEAARVRRKK